jgi:hypothetical protein
MLASIDGKITDVNNQPVLATTVCLYSNDKKIWCGSNENGLFGGPVLPGSYQLRIGAVGYKSVIQSFSIDNQTTIHFTITLAMVSSLAVFEIHSKIKLTNEEINRIKKCVAGTDDFSKCGKKDVYFIMLQI